MTGWDLLIDRSHLSETEIVGRDIPDLAGGEALLRVDRVGMTANNVTYALAGDLLSYWSFFPVDERWGRVPLWGFADVIASRGEVTEGTRVYGYLPTSSHLVVTPDRVRESGFRDAREHRAGLPGAYNNYAATVGDRSYAADREDLMILFRPLFYTSFMLDDFLAENDFFGAGQIVCSSGSSKTAYATAFCISQRHDHPELVALTSERNVGFTSSLPYDSVAAYEEIEDLPVEEPTLYLDFAGNNQIRARIHERFGDRLVYDSLVGVTHQEGLGAAPSELPGPAPAFFFAPDQIKKRQQEWGPGAVDDRYAGAWASFAAAVTGWVEIKEEKGPEGLQAAWLQVLGGNIDPRHGLVVSL